MDNPRPIAVGDTVRDTESYAPHRQRMVVQAIANDRAWCLSCGYDYIIPVEELERVP